MAEQELFAVVTGDIVGSSALEDAQSRPLPTLIKDLDARLQIHFGPALHGEIDVFRGDSWQLVIREPVQCLRISLFLRALLQSANTPNQVDTRLAIGLGTVDYLPQAGVATGNGQAFRLSGECLESCPTTIRMAVSFAPDIRSELTRALNLIIQLMDLQIQRWTGKQAEAVAGALLDYTQRTIAEKWVQEPVSQQAISQHLEAAGWPGIQAGLGYFEEVLPEILER